VGSAERDGSTPGEDDPTDVPTAEAASAFEGSTQDDGGTAPSASDTAPAEAEADLDTGTEAAPGVREPTIVVGEADEADDDGPSILDPSYEELWEGTDAMQLDIPALDLDWGDLDEGEAAGPYA